jgi:predicted  nucleic acid-binding Zn-ribbon protein
MSNVNFREVLVVNTLLDALLALQAQDDVVDALRARLDALTPRLAELDQVRQRAIKSIEETRAGVDADERRQRELEGRIADHRQRHERNVAHLDAVKRMREATAAMLQVEAGRKLLMEEENELKALVGRVADLHGSLRRQEASLQELDASQAEARAEIEAERAELGGEFAAASGVRKSLAADVEAPLLHKYDRIRNRRRSQALFVLDNGACSCCDTAVPVQRRSMMASTGVIEVCEACGVLLYAS